jgi:hypothetical protein
MKITIRELRNLINRETKKVIRLRMLPDDKTSASSCPLPTQDLKLNTQNRNAAIEADHIEYGPLNLSDESYWEHLAEHWKTTVKVAKQSRCGNCAAFDISPRMDECMPGRIQKDGELGYCWMHHFKCLSNRTCYTWAAGGPITTDEVSLSWAKKAQGSVSESRRRRLSVIR